jgi:hypothetical protein
MSGTAIIRALLVAHAPLTTLVPADRIRAGILPEKTVLPAVSVTSISENEQETTARNLPGKMIKERVQVTVLTKDAGDGVAYVSMKRALRAAALGPGVHTGVIAGYHVCSVLPWGVGPEIPPGDDKIYEQSRDFMVTFIEAN